MLRQIAAAGVFGMLTFASHAQTDSSETKPFTFSGFLDTYYKYDFGKSVDNNYTSFTNSHNSFELGMASLKMEGNFGKVKGVIDLGFGTRAKEFAYNDEGITQAIKQLYVSYAVNDKLSFTAGSWATHVGYELVDAPLNRNYSMSYMFSYGPFTHTGLKADYNFGSSGVTLGIANPTDYRTTNLGPKFVIGQFRTTVGKLAVFANYVGGKTSDESKMNQYDAVATLGIADGFSIGYNGTIARFKNKNDEGKYSSAQTWWGSALYFNADFSERIGITLRSEYFEDQKKLNVFGGVPGIAGGSVFANTLSAQVHFGKLTLIPEFRMDHGSKEIFTKADGSLTKTGANVLMAAVFAF